ncbi:MAG: hypothetical protein CMD31_09845 [Flavobacteriales bacterium]|nr:hypothetical protein [Flavobacteriales bacterium]|tara:strand:- start:121751 stop:125683 length:3933 start_codon:yes stop_codon:yes gene_type:complete
MKRNLLLLAFMLTSYCFDQIKAQGCMLSDTSTTGNEAESTSEAKNGWRITTSGTLRVLVIYMEVDYDVNPGNDPYPNGSTDWTKGQLPSYKDDLFDAEWSGNLQGSITKYYAQASYGNFKILGDYVDSLFVVKESELSSLDQTLIIANAITQINQIGVLNTKSNMMVADFDNWEDNDVQGEIRVAGPDSPHSFDHIFFVVQNNYTRLNIGSVLWFSTSHLLGYAQDTWSETSMGVNPTTMFIHEFGHLLFGGNNFHTGGAHSNFGTGKTFIPNQGGWSIMGGSERSILTFNAWDRDRMEWQNPSKIYLNSALDENLNEVETALDATNSNHEGIYILRDFVTTGDMLQIKLPNILGTKFQQYLWIENHQTEQNNGFEFDRFQHQNHTCMDEMQPGLYMYMQVGKDIKVGTQTYSQQMGHYTRPIPANGMYDLQFESTTTQAQCVANGMVYPFEKLAVFANPLTGNQDNEMSASDNNSDNLIIGSEGKIHYVEKKNGQYYHNIPMMGKVEHPFTKNGVNKIGVGTNPSANSMITMHNLNAPNDSTRSNNKVILNGISIEVLDELPDGSIKVEVKFDDTNIANDVRWCGTIELPAISGANGYSLNLIQGNTMLLDQGFTATKMDNPMSIGGTNYFVDPTVLSLQSGSYFHLEQNATVNVKNNSTLRLKSGSKMELESGAKLHIFEDSDLIIEDGAELILKPGAILIIEEGATVYYNNQSGKGLLVGATSISGNAARVEVKGDMVFDANAVWTHNRDGYYYFYPNHQLTMPGTVEMNFTGKGKNHLFIALVENTNLLLGNITATLNTGMVYYNNNSSIQLNQTDFTSVAVTYNPSYNVVQTGIGLNITNPTDVFINGCDFNYLATGIKIEQASTALTVQATNMTGIVDDNYYIDDVEEISITGGILDGGDYGVVAINTEILEVTNAEIKNMQTSGVNLDEVAGAYFSNTKIHANTDGIYSDNSLVFLRNGAKVYDNQDYGIDMYGVYNTQTRSFTSMLTIGDEGCGSVFDNTTTGIKTKNTLLNIDAVQHTIDRQDNDTIPNQFYGNGHMFDICYSYLVRSPGQINAKGNYWGTNPPIQSSEYTLTANYCPGDASTPQSISLNSDDYSTCYSSTTCMDCSSGSSSMMMSGGTSTVEAVVQESFTAANKPFIEQDNATTRNAFLDLSSIDLIKDTVNNTWMGVSVNNQAFALTNKSVHHIQVAKAIKAKATNSNMRVSAVPKDIFAGITENANESANVQVYPNPVSNELNISHDLSVKEGAIHLEIMDVMGRVLINKTINHTNNQIDINQLSSGLYFYNVLQNDKVVQSGKLVVE